MKQLVILILTFHFSLLFAQQKVSFCGMSHEDQSLLKDKLLLQRSYKLNHSRQIDLVPVSYMLVCKSDGSSRLKYTNALEHLCSINKMFENVGFIFYLDEIRVIADDDLFKNINSAQSLKKIKDLQADKKSIRIFAVANIEGLDPGILAFYAPLPSRDNLVILNDFVNNNAAIFGVHELGHFFGLPHTSFGWGLQDYDCTQPTPLSTNNTLVEFVDRNKLIGNQRHCHLAGDGFCDTQADYAEFLNLPTCVYNSCGKDPDNVPLQTDITNLMYKSVGISNCKYSFSAEQVLAMKINYGTIDRDYLRKNVTILDPIINIPPANLNVIELSPDTYKFTWDIVPDARGYILEIAKVTLHNSSSYQDFIVYSNDTIITGLSHGIKYAYRVSVFNNSQCSMISSSTKNFVTTTSIISPGHEPKHSIKISSENHTIKIKVSELDLPYVLITLTDLEGAIISEERIYLQDGQAEIIKTVPISSNYLVTIKNNNHILFNRMINVIN